MFALYKELTIVLTIKLKFMKNNYKKTAALLKSLIFLVLLFISYTGRSQTASFASPTGSTVSGTLTNPISSGTMCAGVYTFTNASTGATSYTWFTNPSTNVTISNAYAASPTFTFSNTTLVTYTISLIAGGAGPNAFTGQVIKVVATPTPVLSASSASICSGSATTLSVSQTFANYLWSNSATTQTTSVSPSTSTVYSFTTTLGGIPNFPLCTATNTININVTTTPTVLVSGNTTVCAGQSTTLFAQGASTYSWSNGPTTAINAITPSATATYTVDGFNGTCAGSKTISIIVNPLPFVAAFSSASLSCAGQPVILTASTSAASYTWSNGSSVYTISVSPTVTTTYSLTGTSAAGCVATAAIVQNVSACTGISNPSNNVSLVELYPNPTSGEIYMSMQKLEDNYSVEVYNNLGMLINKRNIESTVSKTDLTQQPDGIYYIRVIKEGKQVNVFRVIKN